MSCAVDPVAWGEKNRVALSTGKKHEWVLARTTRDNPTVDEVIMTARAVLVKWFDGVALDTMFADAGKAVDDVVVVAVSERPPVPSNADQRRESLDPVPLLAPSPVPPLYVTVRFNYRGYAQSLPWPVWTATASPLRVDKLCPLSADWMLVWAKNTAELETAPEELGALDKLTTYAPGPIAGLAQLTQLAGWGIGLYLAVQVLGIARTVLPRARPRSARRAA